MLFYYILNVLFCHCFYLIHIVIFLFFLSSTFCSDHMENVAGYLMKYTNLVTGWQYR